MTIKQTIEVADLSADERGVIAQESKVGNLPVTTDQIVNCKLMGWSYLGEGLFGRGDEIGYFNDRNFIVE